MAIYTNFTRFALGESAGLDPAGEEFYSLIVKATFEWTSGELRLCKAPQPLVEIDTYAGEPGLSGLLHETDYVPFKPRVDVLVAGEIVLPAEVQQVDAVLEVGREIKKTVRVFGNRVYAPLGLTSPKPFSRMPISWDHAYGGTDPEHPKAYEKLNPVGRGVRARARDLEGTLAPNFEDPWNPKKPACFAPIAKSWAQRLRYGGTYDEKWQEERFPLAPEDFDPLFHNCAPEDQQLDAYVPGTEVRLTYMSPAGHDRFVLPSFDVPLRLFERTGVATEEVIRPDTIIIEPAHRRLSLIGRHCHFPKPNLLALQHVLVGEPWPGWWRAFQTRKRYIGPIEGRV